MWNKLWFLEFREEWNKKKQQLGKNILETLTLYSASTQEPYRALSMVRRKIDVNSPPHLNCFARLDKTERGNKWSKASLTVGAGETFLT